MPDPNATQPPYLDPSAYPDYLDMQRKQMLAQMLMQNTQQSNQTPSDWNQMRLVPRRSPLQGLSTLASSMLAANALKGSQQAQQKYFQNIYGGGQPQGQSAPAQSQGPPQPGQQPQMQQPQQNPLIPNGMSQGTAQQMIGMMGPEKYAESFIAPNYKPAEVKAEIRAAGIDPDSPLGRQLAQGRLAKSNYVAPIEQRPGAIERDPFSNQVIGQNPSLPQGAVNTYDREGKLSGSAMSPGATEAIAQAAGAQTAGKVANEYTTLPTASGGSAVVGGPHTGLPNAPSYFPKPTALPGSAAPPQAPPVNPNSPWASMPKLATPEGIGAPGEFTKTMLKNAADKHAELVTKYGAEADTADQKMNYNNEALKALPNAEVGPISHFMTENRAKLQEWGVSPKLIPGSGTVTPTFELNKNLLNSALQGAKQIYGARMTSNEVMLQKNEASPSVATSQQAVKSLIQQDNAKNAYFKQRSQDYGQYMQQGGDPNRFESWYSNKFPLQDFAKKYATPPQAIALLKTNPASAAAFKQKYGWLPDASSSP
jgi:hypothetical protein